MASKPLLDFEALLAPIPGDNPAGPALRYSGDYDELKALLPKADRDAFEASGQEGQWPKLIQLAKQKLQHKSKDLSIAWRLTDGLVHVHKFAGLRDGFRLIHGLCERFWEGVHPTSDDGDLDFRASPLRTLLEEKESERNAAFWIGEIPLTKEPIKSPETDEIVPVTYNLYQSVVITPHEDKKALLDPMKSMIDKTPNDFLLQLYEDVQEAEDALNALKQLLNERFGQAAPSTVHVFKMLGTCKNQLAIELKKRGISPDQGAGEEAASDGEIQDSSGRSRSNGASGPLGPREDALAKLREVADFFRRTEPHSPVPYLIQRAINWSRMSFDQLLAELVKDENSRQDINTTLGIRSDGSEPAHASSSPEDG